MKIDPGAKFVLTVWPINGAITATSKSHIKIEGIEPAGRGRESLSRPILRTLRMGLH